MDITKECEALETKLRGFCHPPIYLNAKSYDDADPKMHVQLVKRIINQASVDVQQLLMDDGYLTSLQHYVGRQFYEVFANYLREFAGPATKSQFTVLAYDQFAKRQFSAVKMRMISVFVDILKHKLKAGSPATKTGLPKAQEPLPSREASLKKYREMTEQIESATTSKDRLKNGLETKLTEGRDAMAREQEQLQSASVVDMQRAILQMLKKIDLKVEGLSARVDSIEGIVKGLYVEVLNAQKESDEDKLGRE